MANLTRQQHTCVETVCLAFNSIASMHNFLMSSLSFFSLSFSFFCRKKISLWKIKIIRFASIFCRNEIKSQEIRVIKRNSYNDAQKCSARERENEAHNWLQRPLKTFSSSTYDKQKVFVSYGNVWRKQFIYNLEN